MSASARPLLDGLRAHVPALLARHEDPHAELLALVWGPRFDREHALGLLSAQAPLPPEALGALLDTARRYDGLHAAAQQRLRRLILRHRATMAHHAPHSAD